MKLNELVKVSTSDKKRIGRGTGAGTGKTAGRGTKGQNSRSGGKRRPGFEGGQTPFVLRIPKRRGFKSRVKKETITLETLKTIKEDVVDKKLLKKYGIIRNVKSRVKLVGKGKEKIAKEVNLDRVSKNALESIK